MDLDLGQKNQAPVTDMSHNGFYRATIASLVIFVTLYLFFWAIDRHFPYIKTGSDVVFDAKMFLESKPGMFRGSNGAVHVVIFGNSRVMAGFIPSSFDGLANRSGKKVYSYNSGFPARDRFIPTLASMIRNGNKPDVILLTQPWQPAISPYHFFRSDFEVADDLFPFRHLPRDLVAFFATSLKHGGPVAFYAMSRAREQRMLKDRGYYFISEQSKYPEDRLPADFHDPSDQPNVRISRSADPKSDELTTLRHLLQQYHVSCYYVPQAFRETEAAPAAPIDTHFVELLEGESSCRVLGPDYFSYPNELFSDERHLNRIGAERYTKDLYRLLDEAGFNALQ